MARSDDEVKGIFLEILKQAGVTRSINDVYYRDDYQDYRVIVDDVHRCEIREKLVDDYCEFHHKDTFNEICYLIEHAVFDEELEFERNLVNDEGSDGMITDDNKYDFL